MFVRFRLLLLDQFQVIAYLINDFGIVNVTDPKTWALRIRIWTIKMNVVNFFKGLSFLFLAKLYCIDLLYQFK